MPMAPTAVQNDAIGHETALRRSGLSKTASFGAATTVQAVAPPAAFVDVAMVDRPTATHKVTEGHETPCQAGVAPPGAGSVVCVHAGVPPVGSVDVITPPTSGMTHSEVEGHAGVPSGNGPATLAPTHTPPEGSVAVNTSPPLSVATHNETEGHEIPVRTLLPSCSDVGGDQEKGTAGATAGSVVVVAGDGGTPADAAGPGTVADPVLVAPVG